MDDIANPGSALGEAIGALLEEEIHRILKPLAEASNCVYVTTGPTKLRERYATVRKSIAVLMGSWSKPSKRLLHSFEVELFEITCDEICDVLAGYGINYRWAEKDRAQAEANRLFELVERRTNARRIRFSNALERITQEKVRSSKPETFQDALLAATRALGATMQYDDARLQAELLLAHTLETTRAMLLARLNETVASDVAARYAANVARRAEHEPLAYIVGHQEFYGLDFVVDRRVLIPRHETETLAQLALERAPRIAAPVIVDVGTGSGALALTLAHHLPDARVFAVDTSRDALDVARLNAKRLNLDARVQFRRADLLDGFDDSFDLLVANLPYIPTIRFDQLPREIRAFEPRHALDGGDDGLAVMRRLLAQLESHANRGAIALLEISEEQGVSAMELVRRTLPRAANSLTLHRDAEGLDRVVEIRIEIER